PALARLGSGVGRILPAIRTAGAYPLTSRFRTGVTMAMIGLIMFALVVNAAINKNFSSVFLNEDTKGGFDVIDSVNGNNPIGDVNAALKAPGGPDVGRIRAAGEVRIALSTEAQVANRDHKTKNSEGKVDE